MANIRTGSIVSDIRGKVGSEIYSRNRGGAYVKAYSGYTENWNARQIASQTALTAANSLWQSLTESERRQWDTFANSFDASSYFVNKRFSGRTLFIKLTFQKDITLVRLHRHSLSYRVIYHGIVNCRLI